MHDAIAAEKLGVPALAVMTESFVSAAELMARVLGMPGYPFVVIEHPVSSATDEQLGQRAQHAAERARELLIAGD